MGMEVTYHEALKQEYADCVFSAGLGMYMRMERDAEAPVMILLRPDEAAAIVYCLSGALWSVLIDDVPDAKEIGQ